MLFSLIIALQKWEKLHGCVLSKERVNVEVSEIIPLF